MSNNNKNRSYHIRIDNKLINEIDKFTNEFHFSNRSDSIRFLIASGLKYHEITTSLIKQENDK